MTGCICIPGWQHWSNTTIMVYHGMNMVFYTHHDMIMAISCHICHDCHGRYQDHTMVVMEDTIIIAWSSWKIPWSCCGDHCHYYLPWSVNQSECVKNSIFKKKTWKNHDLWSYQDHAMCHRKHGDLIMIIPWIMTTMPRNMVAVFPAGMVAVFPAQDHWRWVFQVKLRLLILPSNK